MAGNVSYLIGGRFPAGYHRLFDRLLDELRRECGSVGSEWQIDAGCCQGRLLARLTGRAVGVELNRSKLTGGGTPVLNADVRLLPFRDRAFAVAFAVEVIEHVREERRMLAELFRVLRPGGRLVLTTSPLLGTPMAWLLPLKNRLHPHHAAEHVNLQTPGRLRDTLCAVGFTIHRERYWNPLALTHYLSLFGWDRLAASWERLARPLARPPLANNLIVVAERPLNPV